MWRMCSFSHSPQIGCTFVLQTNSNKTRCIMFKCTTLLLFVSHFYYTQQARLLFQVKSPSSWTQTQPLTLLCSPSPAPPLVVLPPLSPGGGMVQCSVMTAPTVSLLKCWQMQWQPPTLTHWQWQGDWWESISAVCPTSGHLQEVTEA